MKVIKEGKKIIGVMRVTCMRCYAELEIEARDIKEEPEEFASVKLYSYKCPCCSRTQYLYYEDLTEEILFDMNKNNLTTE